VSLKQRFYDVAVGSPLAAPLQQATNEDVQHVLTFTDAATPLGSGALIDLTGMASIKLTAKAPDGTQLFQIVGAVFGGDPTKGKASFSVLHGALAAAQQQSYLCDVLLVDGTNNQNELLVPTPFLVIKGIT
jgi:hypothetical protein